MGAASSGAGAGQGPAPEPVAIVGMACRFPGAPDLHAFWRLICEARDATGPIPASRWDVPGLVDSTGTAPGKMVSDRGGFLEAVAGFDWRAFRMSPREARDIDPQHRLLMEVAWEALEDAGVPQERLSGCGFA